MNDDNERGGIPRNRIISIVLAAFAPSGLKIRHLSARITNQLRDHDSIWMTRTPGVASWEAKVEAQLSTTNDRGRIRFLDEASWFWCVPSAHHRHDRSMHRYLLAGRAPGKLRRQKQDVGEGSS
jgi:hypothetical protein